jgi:hypothetical protein
LRLPLSLQPPPRVGAGALATPLSGRRATPRRREPAQTFEPRRRVPDTGPPLPTPAVAPTSAIPLRPGRRIAEALRPTASSGARDQAAVRVWRPAAPASAAAPNQVRLIMSPIPARSEAATASREVLVPVSGEPVTARASVHPGSAVAYTSRPLIVPQAVLQGAGRAHPTADVAATGEALPRTGAQANTVTLPMAVWRRGSLPPAGGRRH